MLVFYGCSAFFSQLKFIVDDASKQPAGPGLGSLTSENRTVWTKVSYSLAIVRKKQVILKIFGN